MPEDAWATAHNKLVTALEGAFEAGMTEEEILVAVENAIPSDEPHVGGGPKKPKPSKHD